MKIITIENNYDYIVKFEESEKIWVEFGIDLRNKKSGGWFISENEGIIPHKHFREYEIDEYKFDIKYKNNIDITQHGLNAQAVTFKLVLEGQPDLYLHIVDVQKNDIKISKALDKLN